MLAFEVAGTPFGYHKFSGGLSVAFVGYQLQYDACQVGISDRRGRWLQAHSDSFVVVSRDFSEFLGGQAWFCISGLGVDQASPFTFVCMVGSNCFWDGGEASPNCHSDSMSMLYLRRQLANVSFMGSAKRPIYTTTEIFRTDAKCEDGRVVLAGWEVCGDSLKAKWFRVVLSPQEAPYLYKEGKAQWASTSAELLASYVALFAFGLVSESRSSENSF